MNTAFILLAQYGARAVIPINDVCRDYFPHLKTEALLAKIGAGDIPLPVVRIEGSQKSARGVSVDALAEYLDQRMAAAKKERDQLCGSNSR
jgi:hypothetical protein